MFITADQILLHLVGDYLLQSHWMAQNKTKRDLPCLIHTILYSLPFLLITTNPTAILCIWASHYLIDRHSLAKYVVWAKNGMRGPITPTGYPEDVPPWLAVWLYIIADNTLHLICNGAILYLAA